MLCVFICLLKTWVVSPQISTLTRTEKEWFWTYTEKKTCTSISSLSTSFDLTKPYLSKTHVLPFPCQTCAQVFSDEVSAWVRVLSLRHANSIKHISSSSAGIKRFFTVSPTIAPFACQVKDSRLFSESGGVRWWWSGEVLFAFGLDTCAGPLLRLVWENGTAFSSQFQRAWLECLRMALPPDFTAGGVSVGNSRCETWGGLRVACAKETAENGSKAGDESGPQVLWEAPDAASSV